MHDNEIEQLQQVMRIEMAKGERGTREMYNGGLAQQAAMLEEKRPNYASLTSNSIWEYKGETYQVNSVLERNLSQDSATGHWEPTVRYTNYPHNGLVFYRSYTEFLRKFTKISD